MNTGQKEVIDVLFRDYSGDVPGAAVAVVRNGTVVFERGYGMADREAGVMMTAGHNLRLASMTKQFTATAIEILAERGRLNFDDPLTRWIPSLPPYAAGITIRQLLTHTSGLVDYEDLIPKEQTGQISDQDVLRYLEAQNHTLFPPGSQYRYSNGGYVLLGLIVERASGISLGEFFRREIFTRAGMTSSVVMEPGVAIPMRSFGYAAEGDRWVRRDQSVTSATRGDGAVYSSVIDLARWEDALRRATIVRPATLRQAFTAATPTDEPGTSYGFGWRIGSYSGQQAIWHTGETSGFTNAILRLPDAGLMVVVLTNRAGGDPLKLARQIADLELASH
jgi:CubicO group peptidase (beta-lactamase class C family)